MGVVSIFGGMVIVLFAGAFVTKRRFGLLGLALAAGAILSTIWGNDAGYLLDIVGIEGNTPLSHALVLSGITLLPAVVLLFHGQVYKSFVGRLMGSLLFALLAAALLVEPLGHILALKDFGAEVYAWLVEYRNVIIGGGLIAAVLDVFLAKPAHKYKADTSKH